MESSLPCCICKGTGKLVGPNRSRPFDPSEMVAILKKNQYSARQIMRFLSYRSTRSVTRLDGWKNTKVVTTKASQE